MGESQITSSIYIEGSVNNMNTQNPNQPTGSTTNNSGAVIATKQITEKDVGIELRVTPRINDETRKILCPL